MANSTVSKNEATSEATVSKNESTSDEYLMVQKLASNKNRDLKSWTKEGHDMVLGEQHTISGKPLSGTSLSALTGRDGSGTDYDTISKSGN